MTVILLCHKKDFKGVFMKKSILAVFSVISLTVLALFSLSCASSQNTLPQHQVNLQQATTAVRPPPPPYWHGDGGKGIRLAVLLPDAVGLPTEQNYLPALVQGVLVDDFSQFSAMTVLDRQRLESVLGEIESGIYRTAEDFGRLGEIANVDYVLTGSITRTGTGHALQIQVVWEPEGTL